MGKIYKGDTELTNLGIINKVYRGTTLLWSSVPPVDVITSGLLFHIDIARTASYPGTGTTIYDMIGSNNGTIGSGASYDSSDGGSIYFDGVNGVVTFGLLNYTRTAACVSMWVKYPIQTSQYASFLSSNGTDNSSTCFTLAPNGMAYGANSEKPNVSYKSSVPYYINNNAGNKLNGVWYNLVSTYNVSGFVKMYVNGVQVGTEAATSSTQLIAPNGVLRLGNLSGVGYGAYKGNISQVSVYDRVLTPAEILTNYNATKGRYTASLLNNLTNYFKFNETSGTTATSTTGSVINLNGAAITTGKIGNGIDVQTADYPTCSTTSPFTFSKNTAFTLNFWYKPSVVNQTVVLLDKQQSDATRKGYEFYISGTTFSLNFFGNTTTNWWSFSFPSPMTAGNWYMITILYTGTGSATGVNLYVNNALVTRTIGANVMSTYDFNGNSNFKFGCYFDNNYASKGVMDNLASWDRALTATELSTLYNSGAGTEF
jgi:hypothetical protein